MYSTMTVRQFRSRFRTEKDCLNYLSHRKWPDGFRCPRFDHDEEYLITTGSVYQCKACKHHTSLTAVKSLPRVQRGVERFNSCLRGTHCHVTEKHLEKYPAEFS